MGPLRSVTWQGGEHDFMLPLGQLRTLQENCDAGPEEILTRLRHGFWRVDDIIEVLRLGLVGSGAVPHKDAGKLVTTLMEKHPVLEFKTTAILVLAHALYGPLDDQPGKPEGETPETPPENGSSPTSTETAHPWDSHPPK